MTTVRQSLLNILQVGWDMSVVVEIDFVQNIVNDRTTEHCGKLLWVL
jgi:hypothetical protein